MAPSVVLTAVSLYGDAFFAQLDSWSMETTHQIRSARPCVFNLPVPLVFVTKYPRKVFNKERLDSMQGIFTQVCLKFESDWIELDRACDPVHLLLNDPPKVAMSKRVNSLQGISSRMLPKQVSAIHHFYWKGVLGSSSYCAGSCRGAPIEIVKKYIEQQDFPP